MVSPLARAGATCGTVLNGVRSMPLFRRFRRSRRANVAVIFSLAMFPIIALAGMGLDYTLAGRRQAQLKAVADAAALLTTSPGGMALSSTDAQTSAVSMFDAQSTLITGASIVPPKVTVEDTQAPSGALTRLTTVTFSGTSNNIFPALLTMNTMALGGVSKVTASTAPNIDFYLLLDTSPSMGIVATTDGIATMVARTRKQGGCAFACHETDPTAGDVAGNPNGEDNYTLARSLRLPLRIDLVQQATSNLIQTAAATGNGNKAKYRVATYTFDQSLQTVTDLTADLTQAKADSSNIQMLKVYSNDCLTASNCNQDEDTQFDQALATLSSMPSPGGGTNAASDTPQEVVFIVTDGVTDEAYPNYGPTDLTSSGRTIAPAGHQKDYCSDMKARNIRVAVLYTTYNRLPQNSFYMQHVDSFQPDIANQLEDCASPGLYFKVDTGGDISAAMETLFIKAVGSAHLTQ